MTNKLVENRNLCVVVLFPQVILIELFFIISDSSRRNEF